MSQTLAHSPLRAPPASSKRPRVALIAAVAANRTIGLDNRLPWRLPEDLRRFKALTLGHPVVMGRRTWDAIGRPLPGRTNIVVTRSRRFAAPGALIAHTLDEALAAAAAADEVFVIGGGDLYRAALPLAQRLLLTEIRRELAGGAFFPVFARAAVRDPHVHGRTARPREVRGPERG